ncbi:MAG TPA: hypothetical protein VFO76_07900 [Candidatus Kapabacteria bacterium]|nr:hypothetical protein [Candidatus Kapabacteria bacterium]
MSDLKNIEITPTIRFFIRAGAILLLIALVIPGMSIMVSDGDEDVHHEVRPTIYLLLRLPKIFYDLLTPLEKDYYLWGRLTGFVFSIITIVSCLWQIILVFFRRRIPLPFLSLIILLLCLLDSTIPVSSWVGSEIPKLEIGYYLWVLGYLMTIVGLGITCYDRIHLYFDKRKSIIHSAN